MSSSVDEDEGRRRARDPEVKRQCLTRISAYKTPPVRSRHTHTCRRCIDSTGNFTQ